MSGIKKKPPAKIYLQIHKDGYVGPGGDETWCWEPISERDMKDVEYIRADLVLCVKQGYQSLGVPRKGLK